LFFLFFFFSSKTCCAQVRCTERKKNIITSTDLVQIHLPYKLCKL
jgi:hypothetical protein